MRQTQLPQNFDVCRRPTRVGYFQPLAVHGPGEHRGYLPDNGRYVVREPGVFHLAAHERVESEVTHGKALVPEDNWSCTLV